MTAGPAIRVVLPHHLRNLAGVAGEVLLAFDDDADDAGGAGGGPVTQRRLIDALEAGYPALQGTIRDPATMRRRPFIRFFAGGEDLSHDPPDAPLPPAVTAGTEALHVVGAMAGG